MAQTVPQTDAQLTSHKHRLETSTHHHSTLRPRVKQPFPISSGTQPAWKQLQKLFSNSCNASPHGNLDSHIDNGLEHACSLRWHHSWKSMSWS